MRAEPHRPKEFRLSPSWLTDEGMTITVPAEAGSGLVNRSHSFSGSERNRLFLNLAGKDFARVSTLSGLDKKEDGRSWVRVDVDGDGWQDVILAGPQEPRFRVFRNRLGEFLPDNRALTIQLIGGNETTEASPWSPRTPYGATITAKFGSQVRRLQLASSEGMAAQSESGIYLGLGSYQGKIDMKVRWPSGRLSQVTIDGKEYSGRSLRIQEKNE